MLCTRTLRARVAASQSTSAPDAAGSLPRTRRLLSVGFFVFACFITMALSFFYNIIRARAGVREG